MFRQSKYNLIHSPFASRVGFRRNNKRIAPCSIALMLGICFAAWNPARAATTVTSAGAVNLSADTRADGGNIFTVITVPDPVIAEGAAGEIATSIVITAPAGFQFNTGQNVTATPGGGSDIDLQTAGAGNAAAATPAATTITFNVTNPSTVAGTITFTDIELQPNDCPAAQVGVVDVTITTDAGAGVEDLNGATLATVMIDPGVADHLEFALQPGNTAAGAAILFSVQIVDACDNAVGAGTNQIDVEILNNPVGASLLGDDRVTMVNGVAPWTGAENLRITSAGMGFTFRASRASGPMFPGGDTVDSNAFDITGGPPDHLVFTTQPADPTDAGADLLPVVEIQDEFDNLVTNDDRNITLNIQSNPPDPDASLNGTTMKMSVMGVATWVGGDNLNITNASAGYTLRATGSGVFADSNNVDSAAFEIDPGTMVNALLFVQQPSSTDNQPASVIAPPVTVEAVDMFDNRVTTFAGNITMAIENDGSASPPAMLTGTLTQAAAGGLATFNDLHIDLIGSGYTLRAARMAAPGTFVISTPFNVAAGPNLVANFVNINEGSGVTNATSASR